MNILVFNCGSSSLSYKIFQINAPGDLISICAGKAHRVGVTGTTPASLEHQFNAQTEQIITPLPDHQTAAAHIIAFVKSRRIPVDAIGHRIVNGGSVFTQSTLLTEVTLARYQECLPLAPLHNPTALRVIKAAMAALPHIPHYLSFDSAFHTSIPIHAHTYALPYDLAQKHHFRKYGFHGLSYIDVMHKAAQFLNRPLPDLKIVACHLGTGGSSVTAIQNGQSLDTSMGYSPLQGLVMSTRSGDIDPTVALYLVEQHGYTAAQVVDLLNRQSGLLGVSGISSDIRDLIKAMKEGHERARLAFTMYVYRLKQYIGVMAATLGGLDTLIFTDDVGLYCPEVRQEACEQMAWCGLSLDPAKNIAADGKTIAQISPAGAPVAVLVIPNDEEAVIAREGFNLLAG